MEGRRAMIFALAVFALALQDDYAAWIEDLKSADETKRRTAMVKLLEAGRKAVPALLSAVRNEFPGMKEKVEALAGKLDDADWRARDGAMRELGALGRHARPVLQKHADAADPEARWRIRAALADIDEHSREEEAQESLRDAAICEILGEVGDASCVPDLIRSLGSADWRVRLRAAQGLARRRGDATDAQAAEASEKVLDMAAAEREPSRRSLLLSACGGLRSPASVAGMSAIALDPGEANVRVRQVAVYSLGRVGTPEALAAVVRALGADKDYVRDAALTVLEPLAGGAHGFDPRRDPAAQADAVGRFKAWWEKKSGRKWEE